MLRGIYILGSRLNKIICVLLWNYKAVKLMFLKLISYHYPAVIQIKGNGCYRKLNQCQMSSFKVTLQHNWLGKAVFHISRSVVWPFCTRNSQSLQLNKWGQASGKRFMSFFWKHEPTSSGIIKAKNIQCYSLNSLESAENLPTVKQNVMYKQSGCKAIQKFKN